MRRAGSKERTRILLCGILPTLERAHLGVEYMTPIPRYQRLSERMSALAGGSFKTLIKGLDQLQVTHHNVMLEACNTSFQIHFQVAAPEFARLYNLAQAITAPVLAAAVNSPVMLQHRLWHETRVALMEQSLDTRTQAMTDRCVRRRVRFGDDWVSDSRLELFREDIARFRPIIAAEQSESSLAVLKRGEIPRLRALCMHNGTIYRWNRPCYGVIDGRPHLRIENRALPAGPTPVDQCANAAFFFGLMSGLDDCGADVRERIEFDDVKANFLSAARYGLHARLRWFGGTEHAADELILEQLLPIARAGLASRGIDGGDIDRYLGVIQDRVASGRTGAQWALDSLAAMDAHAHGDSKSRSLTAGLLAGSESGRPVHTWPLASLPATQGEPERDGFRTLGQLMTRDVFTVHPDDLIDLAATVMDWRHLRHVPVEDDRGCLVGLLSHRTLLRCLVEHAGREVRGLAVHEVMKVDPVTATAETTCLEGIELMQSRKVGCLPIVDGAQLVGILSERDFIEVSKGLLQRWLDDS
ncbi:MAG: CBS domain-containing protein [Chlamydiales bacterium]